MRRREMKDFWFSRSCTVPPDSFFQSTQAVRGGGFSGAPFACCITGKIMSLIDDRRRYWNSGKRSAAILAVALVWAGVAGAKEQAPHAPRPVKTGVKTPGVQRPLSELHPETVFPVEGSPDW